METARDRGMTMRESSEEKEESVRMKGRREEEAEKEESVRMVGRRVEYYLG